MPSRRQNPAVRQTSLPQSVPPFDLPIATLVGNRLIMDETWYLFFYNLGKQVLPQENGASGLLTLANLTTVLAGAPDQVYPQPAPSPAGTLYWNGGVGTTGGILARS